MPTRRRAAFDEWWRDYRASLDHMSLSEIEEHLWQCWRAAAKLYIEVDVNQAATEKESRISSAYIKNIEHLKREVARYAMEVAIRKEVHRNDFLRSATQMSALKLIIQLSQPGSPIYELANNAIIETWGIDPTTRHCDQHGSYRSSCPDCIYAGRSKARGHD